jgi:hypothetical protein
MNANQTRTGGVRKSLGRRIEEWLGGRANPACGRSRTRAALAVEGLEERIVLSSNLTLAQAIPLVAKAIVQYAESQTQQQPQNLASVIKLCESDQVLVPLLSQAEGDKTLSAGGLNADMQCTFVDIFVAIDLFPTSGAQPSADTKAAIVTSLTNAMTELTNASTILHNKTSTLDYSMPPLSQLLAGQGIDVTKYQSGGAKITNVLDGDVNTVIQAAIDVWNVNSVGPNANSGPSQPVRAG